MRDNRNVDVLRHIISFCNVVAHHYGKIDDESLWETITSDIPQLKDYCSIIIQQLEITAKDNITKLNNG